MIHPSAIVSPGAQLDSSAEVGPYAVIDAGVSIGPRCRIGPHVCLTGRTSIGPDNSFHAHCVIGDAPQDVKYKNDPTGLRIGANNVFREGSTVHRSNKMEEDTVIGSNCMLMVNSHVAHNVHMGDHVTLANGALLAGHAQVGDRAFISGNCLVHQFVRIGKLAMMQGGSAVSRDLPPFTIARGGNNICGLNTVGLRRAGLSADDRMELRRLYHKLFRSRSKFSQTLAEAKEEFHTEAARELLNFVSSSKSGVCHDHGAVYGQSVSDEPGID